MNFTPTNYAPTGDAVLKNEPNFSDRLDAVSINSDVFEFLELVRELVTAPERDRRAVAAWCAMELNTLEKQIETDNRPDDWRPDDGS